jgi:hypothetical protein
VRATVALVGVVNHSSPCSRDDSSNTWLRKDNIEQRYSKTSAPKIVDSEIWRFKH